MKAILRILFLLLAPFITIGQITQIGQDINGEAPGDYFGYSISLSMDGNIVAIGAPWNDGNGMYSGHVRVYENTGGNWTQIGQDIDGEDEGNLSGRSVSLNSDGSIVAIGAPSNDENGINSGHVRVYENIGGNWTQIGQDIDGEAAGDRTGGSVSLSADGSIVAVGAKLNDGNGIDAGHVRIYENIAGNWVQIGQDIDGEEEGDNFGHSVSLSGDGSILAIGAPYNDGNGTGSGHVRVYENIAGNWVQIGQDIDGEEQQDQSGFSVSLSDDASFLAIGAPYNDDNGFYGHVRVFKNIGGDWVQVGEDIDGGDWLGFSVNLNENGNILAIGVPGELGGGQGSGGTVKIYQNRGGVWTLINWTIVGNQGDQLGFSVSLNAVGSVLAVGAPWNDGNGNDSGHARVFDLSGILAILDYPQLSFKIYPSPTSGILNINSETGLSRIEVYNQLGQLVKFNTNQNTIDISSVDQGVYFVKIIDENGQVGIKRVVKR